MNRKQILKEKSELLKSKIEQTKLQKETFKKESETMGRFMKHEGYYLQKNYFENLLVLKGNIRVFCRVKPITGDDLHRYHESQSLENQIDTRDRIIQKSTSQLPKSRSR